MPAGSSTITVAITGDDTKLGSTLKSSESKLGTFGTKTEGLGSQITGMIGKFGPMGAAVAGAFSVTAVVDFAKESIHAAEEFQAAHARLQKSVENTGQSFEAVDKSVEATDKKMRDFGFTSTETEAALSTLTNITHNVTTAQKDVALAADIARGRHIDLATATGIVAKVEAGRVGLLGRLGIATKDVNGKTLSSAEAIKKLSDLYGGQAQAYTKTLAGQQAILGAQLDELKVTIGSALLPVVTEYVGALTKLVSIGEQVSKVTAKAGVGFGDIGMAVAKSLPGIGLAANALDIWHHASDGANKSSGEAEKVTKRLSDAEKHLADLVAGGKASKEELAAATKHVSDAQTEQKKITDAVTGATDNGREADAQAATKKKALNDAIKAEIDKLHALNEAVLKMWGANISLEESDLAVSDAVKKETQAQKDNWAWKGKNTEAVRAQGDANRDTRKAIVADVEAVGADVRAQIENARARGASISKVQEERRVHSAMIAKLEEIRKKYPEVRDEVNKYINDIARIPRNVDTTIGLATPAFPGVRNGKVARFAEGGLVPGSGPVPAIVHGGETVLTPAQLQRVLSGAASAGPGGGNSYQITLNVPPNANMAEIGRVTIDAITAHERRSGRVYARI